MKKTSVRVAAAVVLVTLAVFIVGGACVSQPFVRPSGPPGSVHVDPERLRAHVRALTAMTRSPENLSAVVAYLEKSLGPVDKQAFEAEGRTYYNVVVSLGPRDADRVVIGAHYDAALALPGADDNASGVAGLLELAPLLRAASPKTRVDLVFWALEEPPFFRTEKMGSVAHARSLKGARVRAAISLEMIGYFSDEPGSQHFPAPGMSLFYPTRANFIAVVGRPGDRALTARVKGAMLAATDLPVYSLNAPAAVTGIDWSDHRSYWDEGVTAVMITDTSFLRNDRYHTPRDTEATLDYVRMAKVVEGAYAAVLAQ